MIGFIIRIIANSGGLYAANTFVPGFSLIGGIKELLMAGAVLAILNTIVKPILKFVTGPLIVLTLGIFIIVINALMLWLTDYIFAFINIQNLTALVWATIIIGVLNILAGTISKIID